MKELQPKTSLRETPQKTTIITGSISDLTELARISNGQVGKVFDARIKTNMIAGKEKTTRTRF